MQAQQGDLVGGIEAGGTKFVCAVGTGPDDIRAETRITTSKPDETIAHAVDFLRTEQARHGPLAAVGIASFGPIDPDPASVSFGHITSTPKPGWSNTDLVGPVRQALNVPVGFDTDQQSDVAPTYTIQGVTVQGSPLRTERGAYRA